FLYIRKGTCISPYANGGAQESGLRAGTENVAGIVGMATALKKNCDEMSDTADRLRKIEDHFLEILDQAHITYIRNGADNRIPGNVSVSIKDVSGEMLLHRLDLKGIAISTGSACDSVDTQISHVIQAIRVPAEYAEGTIRVSFGRENTETDADTIAKALVQILTK
ncbi:MAG: aminotransferase class V-fold PLP-dependent enzyme, partial [Oscillospiraceae bacterium]|nr:aminotransferase class V-fold PLP-dependent enzyme [Oscillospiraceae bacterium]